MTDLDAAATMTTAAEIERHVIAIWEELLDVPVESDDDFFDLGGTSLLVVDVAARLRQGGLQLRAGTIFDHPTPRDLAAVLADSAEKSAVGGQSTPGTPGAEPAPASASASARPSSPEPTAGSTEPDTVPMPVRAFPPAHPDDRPGPDLLARVLRSCAPPHRSPSTLVPLIPDGTGEPLFCIHLGNGHVRFFGPTARQLRAGRPVYGFEAIGYRTRTRPYRSIAETAERYLADLRAFQPEGPYHLIGFCSGAVIAYEMALRLRDQGAEVATLVMADPPAGMPMFDPGWGLAELLDFRLRSLRDRFGLHDPDTDLPRVLDELKALVTWYEPETRPEDFYRLQVHWAITVLTQEQYEPRPYDGPVQVFANLHHEQEVRDYWMPLLSRASLHVADNRTTLGLVEQPLLTEIVDRELRQTPAAST